MPSSNAGRMCASVMTSNGGAWNGSGLGASSGLTTVMDGSYNGAGARDGILAAAADTLCNSARPDARPRANAYASFSRDFQRHNYRDDPSAGREGRGLSRH